MSCVALACKRSCSHSFSGFVLNRAVIEIGRSAVTPGVTILVGVALAKLIAPPIGTAANALGLLIIEATNLRPFFKINHKVQRILSDGCTFFLFQNSPDILPVLSTSMRSAAGDFGSPGIVSTSPVSATMKPAPAETPSRSGETIGFLNSV